MTTPNTKTLYQGKFSGMQTVGFMCECDEDTADYYAENNMKQGKLGAAVEEVIMVLKGKKMKVAEVGMCIARQLGDLKNGCAPKVSLKQLPGVNNYEMHVGLVGVDFITIWNGNMSVDDTVRQYDATFNHIVKELSQGKVKITAFGAVCTIDETVQTISHNK